MTNLKSRRSLRSSTMRLRNNWSSNNLDWRSRGMARRLAAANLWAREGSKVRHPAQEMSHIRKTSWRRLRCRALRRQTRCPTHHQITGQDDSKVLKGSLQLIFTWRRVRHYPTMRVSRARKEEACRMILRNLTCWMNLAIRTDLLVGVDPTGAFQRYRIKFIGTKSYCLKAALHISTCPIYKYRAPT